MNINDKHITDFASTPSREHKIDDETAHFEFDRFCESMDLEADVENMDSDDQNNFEKIKRRMIRAIKNGHLVINEEGEAIYTPQNKGSKYQEPIHFHERTGNTAMAMDGKKKYEDVRKTYSVIAEICKIRPSDIVGLRGIDIKMVEGIFALLMD